MKEEEQNRYYEKTRKHLADLCQRFLCNLLVYPEHTVEHAKACSGYDERNNILRIHQTLIILHNQTKKRGQEIIRAREYWSVGRT